MNRLISTWIFPQVSLVKDLALADLHHNLHEFALTNTRGFDLRSAAMINFLESTYRRLKSEDTPYNQVNFIELTAEFDADWEHLDNKFVSPTYLSLLPEFLKALEEFQNSHSDVADLPTVLHELLEIFYGDDIDKLLFGHSEIVLGKTVIDLYRQALLDLIVACENRGHCDTHRRGGVDDLLGRRSDRLREPEDSRGSRGRESRRGDGLVDIRSLAVVLGELTDPDLKALVSEMKHNRDLSEFMSRVARENHR